MSFDVLETIQSQYATAPKLNKLVTGLWEAIAPDTDIKLFYDNIFNVRTAAGVGLDIWGRIVGATRDILTGAEQEPYLGFTPPDGTPNPDLDAFNNAVFFVPAVTATYRLGDNAFRLVIMAKALANISTGTLPELNAIMAKLLPGVEVSVLHTGTMRLRILVREYIDDYEVDAFRRLAFIPAGVGYDVYVTDAHTFGFDGSELEPFGQGIFSINGDPFDAIELS